MNESTKFYDFLAHKNYIKQQMARCQFLC